MSLTEGTPVIQPYIPLPLDRLTDHVPDWFTLRGQDGRDIGIVGDVKIFGNRVRIAVLDMGGDPQALAVLQARTSRSTDSVIDHLKLLQKYGSDGFIRRVYVGFGHESVGEGASGVACIVEGASDIVTNYFQDFRLYAGTRVSTRYVDGTKLFYTNPYPSSESDEILVRWWTLYQGAKAERLDLARNRFLRLPDEPEEIYNNAVEAWACDRARALLPSAVTTRFTISANFRVLNNQLSRMQGCPLEEGRVIARVLRSALKYRYPASFSMDEKYPESVAEARAWHEADAEMAYMDPEQWPYHKVSCGFRIDREIYNQFLPGLRTLHPREPLPDRYDLIGRVKVRGLLPKGEARDIARHRGVSQWAARLTTRFGFSRWHLRDLRPELREEVEQELDPPTRRIDALDMSPNDRQYVIPLGFFVPVLIDGGFGKAIFMIRQRTDKTAHPLVRGFTQQIAKPFMKKFPEVRLHADMGPDAWEIRRGKQTIRVIVED